MDDEQDQLNSSAPEQPPAGEPNAAAPAEAPKPKRKRKVTKPQPPARPAILTMRDEILSGRRRARATRRVGWELFRDDVKRGRLIAVIGLAVIFTIGLTLLTSSDFVVRSVTVVNARSLTEQQATNMSGVLGSNIFMVDPVAVEQRLLQAPYVKNVEVRTDLPNSVVIKIEERNPSVVWVLKDNTPFLISDDGLIISQATTLEGYVVVYDLDTEPGSLKLGDALDRKDVIETAQEVFLRFNNATGLSISQMEYRIAGGLTVVTSGGQRVMFGDGSKLDKKLAACAALVKDLAASGQQWRRLDLRSPERVAVSG